MRISCGLVVRADLLHSAATLRFYFGGRRLFAPRAEKHESNRVSHLVINKSSRLPLRSRGILIC